MSTIQPTFANAPVGVLVVSQQAIILFANTAVQKMLGYAASELDGCHLDVLLPHSVKNHHSSLIAGFFADPRQRLMGSGRDLYANHRQGHEIPVEIALAPIEIDNAICAIAYVTDLSERVRAIRQRERLIESLPQGVILIDAKSSILMTNPALNEQFGYADGELLGCPLEILLPERYRHTHGKHLSTYAMQPTQRKMGTGRDLTGLHKSGVEFPVEIALSSLEAGDSLLLMAVVSDISVRKKSEHSLRQTNAQLEEFTYVVSHDLRSPLRGIADLIVWVKEDIPAEAITPDVKNNFDRIDSRIAKCERMIDDLLDYAHAGSDDAAMALTDLAKFIPDIVNDLAIPSTFSVEFDIRTAPFMAAYTPLSLGIRNLINNAVKHHGRECGKIRVSAVTEGRFAVIKVEDDGAGIPPGAQERIFKLFHRATTQTEGHGVGLAVTRRLINAHGGSIVAEASADLGGACFRINWPCVLMKEIKDE